MGVVWTIVLGFVIGVFAKLLHPGKESMGFLMTILLGIAGSFLAGVIGQSLGWYQAGEGAGFIASVSSPSSCWRSMAACARGRVGMGVPEALRPTARLGIDRTADTVTSGSLSERAGVCPGGPAKRVKTKIRAAAPTDTSMVWQRASVLRAASPVPIRSSLPCSSRNSPAPSCLSPRMPTSCIRAGA